jgi:hypothetical protein
VAATTNIKTLLGIKEEEDEDREEEEGALQ